MTPTAAMAAVLAAAAASVAVGPRPASTRLGRILAPGSPVRGGAHVGDSQRGLLGSTRARAAAVAIMAVAAAWLVDGSAGPAVGTVVGAAAWVWIGRLESAGAVRAREDAIAALPLTAELLSAAVAAGSPPVVAAEAVGVAVGGRLGGALVVAAASARVGVEPGAAWASLVTDPALRPLARALAAAGSRGASPTTMLERVAEDARGAARWNAEARARAVGAKAAAPLGLCFLPAFVLVGIVPVVAGAGPLLP